MLQDGSLLNQDVDDPYSSLLSIGAYDGVSESMDEFE